MPDFCERLRFGRAIFADHPGEAHADHIEQAFVDDVEYFRFQRDDIGFAVCRTFALPLRLDFSQQVGGQKISECAAVTFVVGFLEANEVQTGMAYKFGSVEISRPPATGPTRRRCAWPCTRP